MTLAPIFDQGGLSVVFPQQALAAIAVKTTFGNKELHDACDTLHSFRRVAAYAGARTPWCGILFFESGPSGTDGWSNRIAQALASFEQNAERLNVPSTPDVIAIVGTAGFIVDAADPTTRSFSVRGFAGDGTIVLLNGLLAHIAKARGSNGAEFEDFLAAVEMEPLSDSPCQIRIDT